MKFIALIALVCFLALQLVSAQNPQQQVCARPPKGCDTQMKYQSCINWHGCLWTNSGKKEGDFCRNDAGCRNKPTLVPTMPPTPPTPSPTLPPTPPTKSPLDACAQPERGCRSLKSSGRCNEYPGCNWKRGVNAKCVVANECK